MSMSRAARPPAPSACQTSKMASSYAGFLVDTTSIAIVWTNGFDATSAAHFVCMQSTKLAVGLLLLLLRRCSHFKMNSSVEDVDAAPLNQNTH
mmetsp:Transcript_96310/g.171113  ORF Transcript_96310/g.171113 Transcript_96310/m.171113 type:complete len:93 (-) Transcript_96310:86-364(-)